MIVEKAPSIPLFITPHTVCLLFSVDIFVYSKRNSFRISKWF